ncbi:MAG: DUF4215 domain-containing protein [Polyangiaceae bacterium]
MFTFGAHPARHGLARGALVAMFLSAFVACSADGDDDRPTSGPTGPSSGSGAQGGAGGGGGQGGAGNEGGSPAASSASSGGSSGSGGAGGQGGVGGQGGAGGAVLPSCGDGILDPGEQCDDDNNDPDDGCSPSCAFEPTGPDDVCPGVEITLTGVGEEPRIGSASGTTTTVLDQYGSFCGGSGADTVFALTPDVTGQLTATLVADYDSVLHARGDCDDGSSEIDCNDVSLPGGGGEEIQFQVAANQTYFIFVDGYGGTSGNFTLDVVVETAFCGNGEAELPEACDDANSVSGDGCTACQHDPGGIIDDCPGMPIFLSGSGNDPRVISLIGDTSTMAAGNSPVSCSGSGNQAVYAVNPDVDGSMKVDYLATFPNATLHVRGECDTSSTQLDCTEATEPQTPLSVSVPVLANTAYYVFADSTSTTYEGVYEMLITVTPGACGNDVLDGGEECDDGNALAGDGCDSCFLEPPSGSSNDICPGAVLPLTGTGSDPRVAVVTATTELLAGNYGVSGITGCAPTVSAHDAVYQVTSDITGKMKVDVTGQFDAAVYVRSSGSASMVCEATGSANVVGCADKLDGNGAEQVVVPVVAGQPTFVYVDSTTTTQAGLFELAVEVTPAVCGDGVLDGLEGCDDGNTSSGDGCDALCQLEPAGANDACPGQPVALVDQGDGTHTATILSGNTNLATGITLTGCTSSGIDAVYAVAAPIDGVLVASVPTAAFNTSIGVRTDCAVTASQLDCSNDNAGLGGETVAVAVTAGQLYFVIVDSTATANPKGPFQLDLAVLPPGCGDGLVSGGEICDDGNLLAGDGCNATCEFEPLGGNDVCPGYAVTLDGSGTDPRTAVITTDTTPLISNYAGSCGGSAREAVYVVTSDIGGTLTAKLTAPFASVIYARSICLDDNSQMACDDVVTSNATSISFAVLPSEPYYLFVDGFSGAFGVSTLDITITP